MIASMSLILPNQELSELKKQTQLLEEIKNGLQVENVQE